VHQGKRCWYLVISAGSTSLISATSTIVTLLEIHSPFVQCNLRELGFRSSSDDTVAVRAAILSLLVRRDGGGNHDVLMGRERHMFGLDGGGGGGEDEGGERIH